MHARIRPQTKSIVIFFKMRDFITILSLSHPLGTYFFEINLVPLSRGVCSMAAGVRCAMLRALLPNYKA